MKKFFIALLIVILLAAGAVYFFRQSIIQQSIEFALRKALPEYVTVEKIDINFPGKTISVQGISVLNADGFSQVELLKLPELSCKFKQRGKNVTEGLALYDLTMTGLTLLLERDSGGRFNLVEFGKFFGASAGDARTEAAGAAPRAKPPAPEKPSGRKTLQPAPAEEDAPEFSGLVTLPNECALKNANIVFIDNLISQPPKLLSFEHVYASVIVEFNGSYSEIRNFSTSGAGRLNGKADETVEWVISLNPKTPKLTMSNRYTPKNIDLTTFAPYISRYSPFNVAEGRLSGTLVIDFDNGQIGSSNEVELRKLRFSVDRDYQGFSFGGISVSDLARYLAESGERIIFDFKVKGQPDNLKFHPGPITKRALTSTVIDTISGALKSGNSSDSSSETVDKILNFLNEMR
ncbi:MAG: DUF748 domain-containing protein [Candidatus Omnitrophota bacterium]